MIEDEAPVAQHRPAAASPIYNDTIRPEVPAYRVEIASDASLARGLFDLPNDHHPESPPVENEPSNPPQPVREVSPLIADNSDLAPTQEHILTWIEAAAPPEAQPKPRKQKPPTEPRPLPSSESPNWSSPAIAPTGPWKSSRASWSYVTLLRWERHYARATRRFGLLGRLFRTGLVRSLLGLLGLAMMLASAAWLLKDWLHWPS